MVWACFSSKGVGRIVLIDGIMDKHQYAKIVEENVRQSARELGLSRKKWIFQQDNGKKKSFYLDVKMLIRFFFFLLRPKTHQRCGQRNF